MADKEQELKFTCQGCGQRLPSGNTPHNYEDCQTHIKRVTDLLGYVKWDREKVAEAVKPLARNYVLGYITNLKQLDRQLEVQIGRVVGKLKKALGGE